jgi:lysophospholipase L1-like esterase
MIATDGVHPNSTGQQHLADTLEPTIATALGL